MKIVFMGTPQFAVAPLRSLVEAGHTVLGVVTRVDKPSGRGRTLTPPAVKDAAIRLGLPVYQPKRVREPGFIETLRTIAPEAIVVAAYGQILPKEILSLPKYGCINIHASLLPFYRGAAPINWAIIRGETRTGITIMQMDEGMDTGAILMQETVSIEPHDTAGTLTEKLSGLGARLITAAFPLVESHTLAPAAQGGSQATLAPLLKKEDGLIDWTMPPEQIRNRVRGLTPWPGAYTFLDGYMIKILDTETASGRGEPGVIYPGSQGTLDVGAGEGRLRILRLQPAGKRPMSAADFSHGHRGLEGKKFSGTGEDAASTKH